MVILLIGKYKVVSNIGCQQALKISLWSGPEKWYFL